MIKFDNFLKEELAKDNDLKREYDALEIEYQLKRALIEIRKGQKMTQKELAALTGIHQSDISKIENGTANPTIKVLQRLAKGLNKKLVIQFLPLNNAEAASK
jgi:transcriptional regulator with XRE-family HTH domain